MRAHGIVNPLAPHYSRFRVAERLLLTGHSHQAWPDVGFEAQQRAWLDAADLVDAKWDRAAEQARRVREGFARLLQDRPAHIALGQNTHELVTRWLSALPLRSRPRIVTTDGEFHTIRRQLDRLAEEGIEVVKVPARPAGALAERMAQAVDDRAACVEQLPLDPKEARAGRYGHVERDYRGAVDLLAVETRRNCIVTCEYTHAERDGAASANGHP